MNMLEPVDEEHTNPEIAGRHPGAESGKVPSAPPPDDDLRTLVYQVLGGHNELRGRVDVIQRDVRTLLNESHQQKLESVEYRGHMRLTQHRSTALLGALITLCEFVQLWLQHRPGGH